MANDQSSAPALRDVAVREVISRLAVEQEWPKPRAQLKRVAGDQVLEARCRDQRYEWDC